MDEEQDESSAEATTRIEAARQTAASGLSLAGLGLRDVPPAIASLTHLQALSLRGNRLTVLPPWIADLTELTVLDLADNQLVELPTALSAMPHLAEIDVARNRHMILPPPDVVAQGTGAMLDFLRAVDGGEPWARPASAPAPAAASGGAPAAPAPATAITPGSSPGIPAAPAAPTSPTHDPEAPVTPSRNPATALRIGAVAVAVGLLGTAAAMVGAGDASGKGTTSGNDGRAASSVPGMEPLGASSSDPTPSDSASPSSPNPAAPASAPSTAATKTTGPSATTTRLTPTSASHVATSAQPPATTTPPTTTPPQYPVAPPNQDLALGRPVTATSYTQNYVASNATDGNSSTYWESTNGSSTFPQTLTVDLGTVTTVGRLVFDLPPVADWNQRTETITIQGAGADGNFSTILGPRGYAFDARTGDTTGVSFAPVPIRYLRLVFTANSGWPAAQMSELGIFS